MEWCGSVRQYRAVHSGMLSRPLVVLAWLGATAAVRLARIFSPGMVLQEGAPVSLYGWLDREDERVTVRSDTTVTSSQSRKI